MNVIPRSLCAGALAAGFAFLPLPGRAQGGFNPQMMLSRLDSLVRLNTDQRARAGEIFSEEAATLNAISPAERPVKGAEVRQGAQDRIRALLGPVQRKVYDLTPQAQGGGLTQMPPANEVARLDALVQLTAAQKADALQIFTDQIEALMEIPAADRVEKGVPIRQGTRASIRALLTPEQQQQYDAAPQNRGGNQKVNPVNLGVRLDAVVNLNDEQMRQVAAIYIQESADLQPLTPEELPTKGRAIRQAATAQIRALLTPEQQKKFDANPNGIEDLEERGYARNFLAHSPAVIARVGPVRQLSLKSSSLISENGIRSSGGTFTFQVMGENRTETLKISWERSNPGDPIQIDKIMNADGDPIQ
jgi:Spy/CpxP family protein refolding chaperone